MRSIRLASYLLGILIGVPLSGYAASPTEEVSSSETSFAWLHKTQNDWSRIIGDTGRRMDGFFADTEVIEQTNNSFVKIALRAFYAKQGEFEVEPLAKFRLDLPALEERLRLTIENDPIEAQSLEETSRENTVEQKEDLSESTIASLKIQFEKFRESFEPKNWKASTSVGIDFDFPSDYFWRAKGSYLLPLHNQWKLLSSQSIYYFHRKGWGETTKLTLEKDYTAFVLRSKSEGKYDHADRTFQFSQRFSLLKELTATRAMNVQFGVLGTNRPNVRVTDYFTNIIYRRKIFEDWLFYELTPELLFPREDDFKVSPSLTAKLEIVFSSK